MLNRSIPAPVEGLYYSGPRPVSIEVREVPPQVSDADLTAFVAAIAASPRGLHLGEGEGAGAACTPGTGNSCSPTPARGASGRLLCRSRHGRRDGKTSSTACYVTRTTVRCTRRPRR